VISLADLKVGERARVQNLSGDDAVTIRMLEMGLTPGVEVEFRGMAPLGDPLEFLVRGYHLSVRRVEAARVEVQRL